jgi:hypothetical protein
VARLNCRTFVASVKWQYYHSLLTIHPIFQDKMIPTGKILNTQQVGQIGLTQIMNANTKGN